MEPLPRITRSDSVHERNRGTDQTWSCITADGSCRSRPASPLRRPRTAQYRSCRWIRTGVSIAAIAAGKYDGYLSAYAEAVRAYRHPVILSFGHEMNGTWYPWGYGRTSPADFVAAWRHIVTLFRALEVRNVTWMWTVNIVNNTQHGRIPPPAPWWPGSSYVNWVGIDGYYLKPNWQFAPLFGPTIGKVRELTSDPILIAETGATPASGQPAKIADAFAGIRAYGLLGFVWFDATDSKGQGFGISTPAAFAAFRKGASSTYTRPGS